MAKLKFKEMIIDWIFWSSSNSVYVLFNLNNQIIFLYYNGSFCFGKLLAFVREWKSPQEIQQLHGKVSNTLARFPYSRQREILTYTIAVPAMRATWADLDPNFGSVCELMTLVKLCAKVGLYQSTVGNYIWSWCKWNVLHAPVPSVGFTRFLYLSWTWALQHLPI